MLNDVVFGVTCPLGPVPVCINSLNLVFKSVSADWRMVVFIFNVKGGYAGPSSGHGVKESAREAKRAGPKTIKRGTIVLRETTVATLYSMYSDFFLNNSTVFESLIRWFTSARR